MTKERLKVMTILDTMFIIAFDTQQLHLWVCMIILYYLHISP